MQLFAFVRSLTSRANCQKGAPSGGYLGVTAWEIIKGPRTIITGLYIAKMINVDAFFLIIVDMLH